MPSEIRGSDNFDSSETGKVLQVVQSVLQEVSSFSLSNTWVDAGLSVTITPSSSTSKILVSYILQFGDSGSVAYPAGRLKRDGSPLSSGISTNTATKQGSSTGGYMTASSEASVTCIEFIDSPSTTSSVTYGIDVTGYGSRTFYINQSGNDMNQTSGISTITVMEIGA